MENTSPTFSSPKNQVLVLASGILTSALALGGVYALDQSSDPVNLMGWYADYVLPVGALLVGVVSGSGFGLASWLTGTKITKGLLGAVVALLLAAYFAARYIPFYNQHLDMSFWAYLDEVTRSFAWKDEHSSKLGNPLGLWGYGLLALEIAGFTGGGLIAPFAMRAKAYCEQCRVYMSSKNLMILPASLAPRKADKKDPEGQVALNREAQEAFDKGQALSSDLQKFASQALVREFRSTLEPFRELQKESAKLPLRMRIDLSYCPRCRSGFVKALYLAGKGDHQKTTLAWKEPVTAPFVDFLQISGSKS